MTEAEAKPAPPQKHRTGAPTVLFLVFLGVAIGAGAAWCGTRGGEPAETTTVRPTPDVIVAVRDLARLESASFHIERVVDLADRQDRLFGLVQVEDAILLVAAGDVTAGVDLAEIRDGDIEVDREAGTARIVLPRPQVFSARLDSQRTYVHTRRTDVLARERQDLETRARQEAERTIQASAVEGGILDRARENAARTVETLVRSLGYEPQISWAAE